MLNRIFDFEIFSSGDFTLIVGQLISFIALLLLSLLFYRLTKAKWRVDFFNKNEVTPTNRRRFERHLRQLIFLITAYCCIKLLKLDSVLFNSGSDGSEDGIIIRFSILIIALIVLVLAWLTEWFFSNIVINKYEKDRREDHLQSVVENPEIVRTKITKLVQYIVIVLGMIAVISNLGWNYQFFDYKVDKNTEWFTINKILLMILIFLLAQIINWLLTQIILFGYFKRNKIDTGTQFAINQILRYVIYTIASIVALNSIHIDMTLLLGGAAALLVGLGLGLQQTFNDFFSGLVLLFERSVSVGDVMTVDGRVGAVKQIGLRSSIIETRANVSIIVPNSKLVNDSVENWSHFVNHGRFHVDVGVAYGSDTALVKKLLHQAVKDHPLVLDYPVPFVRFAEFADSSLNFSIFFFTSRFLIVEDIQSDIRFKIDELFRANSVSIPFPQQDVHIKRLDQK